MKGGKLIHRRVTPEQAAILRRAIANYRKAKKLMKACFLTGRVTAGSRPLAIPYSP
jgi:hypothetical protein